MAQMTQAEFDQWVQANGGPSALKYNAHDVKQIRNPSFDENKRISPTNEQYITQDTESWENTKTGAKLYLRRISENALEVVEQQGADPNKPVTGRSPAQERTEAATAEIKEAEAAEKKANNLLGRGNVTNKEYEDILNDRATRARAEAAAALASRNETRIAAAQEAQNAIARDRLAFDRDKADRPEVTPKEVKGGDGKTYTRVTIVRKDGTVEVRNVGPDGKPVAEIPGEQTGFVPDPKGAPAPHLVIGAIAKDYDDLARFLAKEVADGRISPQQADKLLEQRQKLATSAIAEQTAIVNAQRGIVGDEITQRNQDLDEGASRRTAAGNAEQRAQTAYSGQLGKVTGKAFADAIASTVEASRTNAARWGGMDQVPRVQLPPFLQQLRNYTPGGIAPETELGQPGDPTASPPEFVNGEGGVGLPTTVSRPGPVFRPQPMAAYPGGAPTPGARPAGQPSRPMEDTTPVQMAPSDGGRSMRVWPGWVDQARRGEEWNPDDAVAQMVADPWMDTNIVMDVYRDLVGKRSKRDTREYAGAAGLG